MLERVPQVHLRAAQRRLNTAYDIYRQARGRQYDDAFLEFADVAMHVWSAGIDAISAVMILNAESNLGTSSRRRSYMKYTLEVTHPHLRLRAGWGHLARLHNFQHNLDMPQEQFELNCRGSGGLIAELNELLPDGLRLPTESHDWLLNLGARAI